MSSGQRMMEERLEAAARADDVDALYRLLKEDKQMLQRVDGKPFEDTPVHIAAASGSTRFALEVLLLQPSFGSKLNSDGLSPLHLALKNSHKTTAERLVRKYPELVRVKGKKGYTPLHYAAEMDDSADVVASLLMMCPASIKDVTTSGETTVHVAMRKGNAETLKVLLGWIHRTDNEDLLRWQEDEKGYTALHFAAEANQPEVMNLLIGKVRYVNGRNYDGLTAFDLAESLPDNENRQRIKESLAGAKASRSADLDNKLKFKPSEYLAKYATRNGIIRKPSWIYDNPSYDDVTKEDRSMLMMVAVLVAAVAYQAVLQPPGGFSQPQTSPSLLSLNTTTIDATVVMVSSPHQPQAVAATAAATATSGNITYMKAALSFNFTSNNENDGQLRPGIAAMDGSQFFVFQAYNSMCFSISIVMIWYFLPHTKFSNIIFAGLYYLMWNYASSLEVISPPITGLYDIACYSAYGATLLVCIIRLWWRSIKNYGLYLDKNTNMVRLP